MIHKENAVVEKSIEFAIRIVGFCEVLEERRKYVIATQLLKAGTSIGANIHEAQNAESRADFIHKLKIAVKELEEAKYWLIICERSKSYPYEIHLKESIDELGLILYKIISNAKRNSISMNNQLIYC